MPAVAIPYPSDDIAQLRHEVSGFLAAGFTHVKIKIGAGSLAEDMKRIEAVLELLPAADRLAVDAMNRFDRQSCLKVAAELAPLGLWWFEDICDPLDFDTQAAGRKAYGRPVAAGEALFSIAEAKLLSRYGGLRPAQDILLFDPAQSYGLTHYLEIVAFFEAEGWPRSALAPWRPPLLAAGRRCPGPRRQRGQSPRLPALRRADGRGRRQRWAGWAA